MSTAHPTTPSDSSSQPEGASETAPVRPRMRGIGRVLVIVYAVMALGATGRSFVQIARAFDQAPLAYTLSAVSAVVYIVATLALILSGRPRLVSRGLGRHRVRARRGARRRHPEPHASRALPAPDRVVAVRPRLRPHPLFLPMVGLWWLISHRPSPPASGAAPASEGSAA